MAKSRIQGSQDGTQYKGTLNTMHIVYKREGYVHIFYLPRYDYHSRSLTCAICHFRFRALYKGLVPKVLRLGPGGAIMLVVYDYMHVFLTKKFKD